MALPGKLGEHGSQVAAMVARGEIGRVQAYCETDCLNLFVLYLRWAHLTGKTSPEAHDAAVDGLIRYLGAERLARPHLWCLRGRMAAGDRIPARLHLPAAAGLAQRHGLRSAGPDAPAHGRDGLAGAAGLVGRGQPS